MSSLTGVSQDPFTMFVQLHGLQLQSIGFPESLYRLLHLKLTEQMLDAGNYFEYAYDEARAHLPPTEGFSVQLKGDAGMPKHSNVFVVDHVWTTTARNARPQLEANPELVAQLCQLMNLEQPRALFLAQDEAWLEAHGQATQEPPTESEEAMTAALVQKAMQTPLSWDVVLQAAGVELDGQVDESALPVLADVVELELDEMSIAEFSHLDLLSVFPNLERLSLWGNLVPSTDVLFGSLGSSLAAQLKVLWLNDCPVTREQGYHDTMLDRMPNLQMLDSKMTPAYDAYLLCMRAGEDSLADITSLDLSDRDLPPSVDTQLWSQMTALSSLDLRGNLISPDTLRDIAAAVPTVQRLCISWTDDVDRELVLSLWPNLTHINDQDAAQEQVDPSQLLIDKIYHTMWTMNAPYRILTQNYEDDSDSQWVWYLMDDFGSRFTHSFEPNFRFSPFMYIDYVNKTSTTYSIFWPIEDCAPGAPATRNLLGKQEALNEPHPYHRLLAFHSIEDTQHFGNDLAQQFQQELDQARELAAQTEMEQGVADSSLDACVQRMQEEEAERQQSKAQSEENESGSSKDAKKDAPLRVYTDLSFVRNNLTSEAFEHVQLPEDADILWLMSHLEFFAEQYDQYRAMNAQEGAGPEPFRLASTQQVNEFVGQECIDTKDGIMRTMHAHYGRLMSWLPQSYDLTADTPAFVAEYRRRQQDGEDNTWIIKPASLTRGMDILISRDLSCILRQRDCGPRVVNKYITNPALYQGRKFDLRFIVMVKNTHPLELYVYNMFWIRLANTPFGLSAFEQYEKHFTVMNYGEHQLEQLHYKDFIAAFEQEHGVQWAPIQEKIYAMLRLAFEAACAHSPSEGGMANTDGTNDNRVAYFGPDVMIDANFDPQLIEVNFSPDCKRACEYDPEFYNDIFGCLFTGKYDSSKITQLA